MTPFEPNTAAVDAVFNAREVSVQHLVDLKADTSERFSVRGAVLQVCT